MAILANELRIGNWVKLDWDGVVKGIQVTGITANDSKENPRVWFGHFEDFNILSVSPIPLTPEILQKCGFKQWPGNKWRVSNGDYSFYLYGRNGFYASYVIPCIESLHQLQNLYFALIGTELTYTP